MRAVDHCTNGLQLFFLLPCYNVLWRKIRTQELQEVKEHETQKEDKERGYTGFSAGRAKR